MMEIQDIIAVVISVLTAMGFFKGGQYVYNRRVNGASPAGLEPSAAVTSPGIVTEAYCKERRGEINEDRKEDSAEIKKAVEKIGDKVDGFAQDLARFEGKMIKAANYSVKEHEQRFHVKKLSSASGGR